MASWFAGDSRANLSGFKSDLLIPRCMSLSKLLTFCVLQFPHLWNTNTYIGWFWELKLLHEQNVVHSKHLINVGYLFFLRFYLSPPSAFSMILISLHLECPYLSCKFHKDCDIDSFDFLMLLCITLESFPSLSLWWILSEPQPSFTCTHKVPLRYCL